MKQRSYKATGINLKAMPMGESDRLVTVLTQEYGLVRAIAPGARKHKSRLAGRSGLFVVNDLLFSRGKSLDKLIQAETIQSFPRLSTNLAKLTASQYLAEIALAQALTDQPQPELYCLLIEHLTRIEAASQPNILPCLAQATFHMLALAGVAPDVFRCCLSRSPLKPQLGDPDWRVAFSVSSGGVIGLDEIERLERDRLSEIEHIEREWHEAKAAAQSSRVAESGGGNSSGNKTQWKNGLRSKVTQEVSRNLGIVGYLTAAELSLMQQLSKPELLMTASSMPSLPSLPSLSSLAQPISGSAFGSAARPTEGPMSELTLYSEQSPHTTSKSGTIQQGSLATPTAVTSTATRADRSSAHLSSHIPGHLSGPPSGRSAERLAIVSSATEASGPHLMWRHIEQFLRQYTQYQFDRPIKSAALIDTCFTS